MTFDLPLQEEKVKPHQVTALHLLAGFVSCAAGAVTIIFTLYTLLWNGMATTGYAIGGSLLALGLGLLFCAMFRNRWLLTPSISRAFRIAELVVLLALAGMSLARGFYIPAAILGVLSAAMIFALFWERGRQNPLHIRIDERGIRLPVIARRRFLAWTEVEQVLLRYGTLTIDCHNNRLMQWNVRQTPIDKEDFEAWCHEQIEAHKEQRVLNDW